MQLTELHDSIQKMVKSTLETYKNKGFNKENCIQIYASLFKVFEELVTSIPELSKYITNDGLNFVCQSYYDMIQINDQFLIPDIFDKEVTIKDLSTPELIRCLMLLTNTPFQSMIIQEIKHRN